MRHSFEEDELAYLPNRKRESMIDNDAGSIDSEISMDGKRDATNLDEIVRDYKKNRGRGMLGWFKLKKPENETFSSSSADNESSASGSPSSSKSSQHRVMFSDTKDASRKFISRKVDDASTADSFPERTQAGDLISLAGVRRLPPSGSTMTDQMELLREQIKMLAGEVALSTSSLKRLSEQAAKTPGDFKVQENIQKLKDEIREKKLQMRVLEQRMIGSLEISPYGSSIVEMSQALSRFATELNEKTFELEIKSADNRVLQEQLQEKTLENTEMQETINMLKQQLDSMMSNRKSRSADSTTRMISSEEASDITNGRGSEINSCEEISLDESTPTSVGSLNRIFNHERAKECNLDTFPTSQLLVQAAEIESLKQDKLRLTEEKDELEIDCQKQTDDSSYAKELAGAAAVELRNLAEEVTKHSYQNAKLTAELASAKDISRCRANCCRKSSTSTDMRQNGTRSRKHEDRLSMEEFEIELNTRYQREASLVAALFEREWYIVVMFNSFGFLIMFMLLVCILVVGF